MAFRADALVTELARHIMRQQPVRHHPRCMLRIGQGVQIDDRPASGKRHDTLYQRFEQKTVSLKERSHVALQTDGSTLERLPSVGRAF